MSPQRQKNIIIKILFFFSFSLSLPTFIFAETITLKSGRKIEGKILEKTGAYIKLESSGTVLYYQRKYIENIDEGPSQGLSSGGETPLKDATSYFKKGLEFAAQKQFEAAQEEFKQGLINNSADHNLQEALKILGDLKNGAISEEYALRLFKGSNYLINTEYQQAITEFQEALKINPDNPDIYYYLGVANYSSGQAEEAISYLEKAKDLNTDESEIYYYLGVANYSLGKYQEAIGCLEKELVIFPDDAESYAIIGISNYLSGKDGLAKDNLHKAKEMFKKQGDYLKAMEIDNLLSKLPLDKSDPAF